MASASTCAACGAPLTADARFCGACGAVVDPVLASASAPTTPLLPVASSAPADVPIAAKSTPPADLPVPELPGATPAGATKGIKMPVALSRTAKIAIGSVVGLVVIALGVTIGLSIVNGSAPTATTQQADESDPESESSGGDVAAQPAETSSPSATPTPSAGTDEAPTSSAQVDFSSASGNIRCSVVPEMLTCYQGEHTYTRPSQACKTGMPGTAIGLDSGGVVWPCLSGDIMTANAQPYDTEITVYEFTCSINFVTGITCRNAAGDGFVMEYDRGVKII